MLAKGEVEEIVVYPFLNIAKIHLYPGAIIKGQKSLLRTYTMEISNIDQLEDKLRKEESKLGIKKGKIYKFIINLSIMISIMHTYLIL